MEAIGQVKKIEKGEMNIAGIEASSVAFTKLTWLGRRRQNKKNGIGGHWYSSRQKVLKKEGKMTIQQSKKTME